MTDRRPWSRPRGVRLGVGTGLAVLAIGGTCIAPATEATRPASSQALVVLLGDHVARRAPNADGGTIEAVAARRPLTRTRTVLPVLGHGGPGDTWLRVRLPGRPNGHTG